MKRSGKCTDGLDADNVGGRVTYNRDTKNLCNICPQHRPTAGVGFRMTAPNPSGPDAGRGRHVAFAKESAMKKLLCLVCVCFALSLASPVFACYTIDDASISKVDTEKKTLVVTKGDKTQSFTTAAKTAVTING